MNNQYRNNRWIKFREEIIELDGGACTRCRKSRESGFILQVHHKKYLPGKALWEYPLDLCETLCKGCHAAEHGEIRPETGWECVGDDDLGGLYGTCDRCNTEIRYVFFVQHPKWEPMAVGIICCDDLTGTKVASEKRKHEERLSRFIKSKRWSEDNGHYLIKQKQIEIRLIPVAGGFHIQLNDTKGKKLYPSLKEAKMRVFNFIASGEADNFFRSRRR